MQTHQVLGYIIGGVLGAMYLWLVLVFMFSL